jgi:hypothetical protein
MSRAVNASHQDLTGKNYFFSISLNAIKLRRAMALGAKCVGKAR